MTDQERAERFHEPDEYPDPWPRQREGAVAGMVVQFAEVRADERQTIAVWLLERTGMVGVAHLIATGEYAS